MLAAFFTCDLADGEADAFRTSMRLGADATRTAPEGALFYEAFLSEDGRQGALLEGYASDAAFVAHLAALRGAALPPMPGQNPTLLVAGDLGEKMQAKIQGWPGARFVGPAIGGVIESRADAVRAGMIGDEAIFALAHMTIPRDSREHFRTLATKVVDLVNANEPDTIAYEWFLDDSGTQATVFDIYRNEAAMGPHRTNAGPVMAEVFGLVDARLELYGALSPETAAVMAQRRGAVFKGRRICGLA